MKQLNKSNLPTASYPIKVLQFGEGNFLRAFVDWMIQKVNDEIDFNAGIMVVQPLKIGLVDRLRQQDYRYHVILEGVKSGQPIREIERIDCIQDAVNPYSDYEAYESCFFNSDLELVVSNTTEAGITRVEDEDIYACPPQSFPGKVCQLLYQRFNHFKGAPDKGLTFMCCELIDKNATVLREIVLELATANQLEHDFIQWIHDNCTFCNTLVDRIVTGFPKDNIHVVQRELGYEDNLVVVGEYFHLWAIEAPQLVREKFPFDKAGLNVVWLDDMTAFRDKKVRILNGSHTALVPVGLLKGYQTVKEAFDDQVVANFIRKMVGQEVIPNINADISALQKFSEEILERFSNPYINHYLKDISLNSLSKWMTRNYPSFMDYYYSRGQLPKRLTFSLAALLVLYKGYYEDMVFEICDTPEWILFIQKQWANGHTVEEVIGNILGNKNIWGEELAAMEGLSENIVAYVKSIQSDGIQQALTHLND
jgi:tagaturonate reductase